MMCYKYVMTMPIVISLSGYASFSFLRNVVQLLFLHHHFCDLGQSNPGLSFLSQQNTMAYYNQDVNICT